MQVYVFSLNTSEARKMNHLKSKLPVSFVNLPKLLTLLHCRYPYYQCTALTAVTAGVGKTQF